jgi:hypothetical protein
MVDGPDDSPQGKSTGSMAIAEAQKGHVLRTVSDGLKKWTINYEQFITFALQKSHTIWTKHLLMNL